MPTLKIGRSNLYFCLNTTNKHWVHQGSKRWARVVVSNRILSLPLIITLIVVCLSISGILNGLVRGLMPYDIADLKVIASTGEKERKYGKAILSVRKQGNFLLMSLVVGAALLNSTATVLINLLVSEWMTILIVTLAIITCCEVIPDLIVCWYALIVGAKTTYLTWTVMILTSPLSYPLGKLLDKLLGKDVYNLPRDRLKELVKGYLDDDEERDPRPHREPSIRRGQDSNLVTSHIQDAQPVHYSEPSTGGDLGPTRQAYYRRALQRRRESSSPRDEIVSPEPPTGRYTETGEEPSNPREGSPSQEPTTGGHLEPSREPSTTTHQEQEEEPTTPGRQPRHNQDEP